MCREEKEKKRERELLLSQGRGEKKKGKYIHPCARLLVMRLLLPLDSMRPSPMRNEFPSVSANKNKWWPIRFGAKFERAVYFLSTARLVNRARYRFASVRIDPFKWMIDDR